MVEFQMANRGGMRIERLTTVENENSFPILLPFQYPKTSALIPTFDCEGKYGGGSSTKGESVVIPQILNLFKNNGCKGTFNFVGKTAKNHKEIVREVYKLGNDVWGHGYSHEYIDNLKGHGVNQEHEINKTIDIISDITESQCIGWRSPYGTFNDTLYSYMKKYHIIYGSNWGNSTWGFMPFNPIINGEKIGISELPFDDVHFDAMVYRKLNLSPVVVEDLYKSKLLSTMNRMSIFTPLFHPVNLAESKDRVKMIENFISFASNFENLWVTNCSDILKNYNIIKSLNISNFDLICKNNHTQITITIVNKSDRISNNKISNPLSIAYKINNKVKSINTNSQYEIKQLNSSDYVICIPLDINSAETNIQLEIEY